MQKTIEQFSDCELKSMKSDIYESNMQNAQNLQIINTELQRRVKEAQLQAQKVAKEVLETKVEEKTDDTNQEPKV
jgi:regulator of replication initiation timing